MTTMDPFEARLQFIQILEQLNPSSQAITKGVSFALKNKELHEDFHSCILEVLDRIDLNSRINVLYFIESLVSAITTNISKTKDEISPYVNNLENDFPIILKKVVPNQNLINLKSSSDILTNIEKYYNIDNTELRDKFEEVSLENIDQLSTELGEESSGFKGAWRFLILNKQNGLQERLKQLKGSNKDNEDKSKDAKDSNGLDTKAVAGEDASLKPFSKDQILSRIEADRERHKRFKEVNWIVNRPNGKIDFNEFEKIWDQHDELDEDDYQDLQDLNQIAKESYQV